MSKFAIILRADKWSHCFYHPPILRYHLFHLFVVRTVGDVLDESTNQGAQPFVLRNQFFFAFFHLGFCFGFSSLPLGLHRNPLPPQKLFFLNFSISLHQNRENIRIFATLHLRKVARSAFWKRRPSPDGYFYVPTSMLAFLISGAKIKTFLVILVDSC